MLLNFEMQVRLFDDHAPFYVFIRPSWSRSVSNIRSKLIGSTRVMSRMVE